MRHTDASKYEILYDLPEGEYTATEVGAIRTRTVRAGDSLEVESFPIVRICDGMRREYKKRKSGNAQQILNRKNSEKRFRRLLETNFGAGDWVLHPTYDYGFIDRGFMNPRDTIKALESAGYPMDDEDAVRILRNFFRRIKTRIKQKGGDPKAFKYMYVVEATRIPRDGEINPLPPRYHYHIVMSGMGVLTIGDINECWQYGFAKAEPLDMRFNGLEGLSNYFLKQRRGKRKWASSKNLKKPDENISDRKISRRRAAQIATDVQHNGREIMEKLYPGYRCERVEVKYSDFVAGAYIYARMRRIVIETYINARTKRKQ